MPSHHQFRAGYILEGLHKSLKQYVDSNPIEQQKLDGLLNLLTTFEAKSDHDLENIAEPHDSVIFVLHNLIIRGMPTWISLDLEKEFAKNFTLLKPYEKYGAEGFEMVVHESLNELLIRAMHLIEPRINRLTAYSNYLNSWEEHGSTYEERYLYREVPTWIDQNEGDYFIQLLEPQRLLSTMVTISRALKEMDQNFREQRADFVIEYPYPLRENGKKGLCLEIDGLQHNNPDQKLLDQRRDDALVESGWAKTLRIKTIDFNENGFRKHFEAHYALLQTDYFRSIKENYRNPLYVDEHGLIALQLILSPMAIARIQLMLVRAIMTGMISLDADKLRIAVFERDVPCANLALMDFQAIIKNLLQLEGKGRMLPQIEIVVFNTPEFDQAALKSDDITMLEDYIQFDDSRYDLLIDISMLERKGLSRREIKLTYDHYIEIRSSFSTQSQPVFLTTKRINWLPLFDDADTDYRNLISGSFDPLNFLLNNIFRKKEFRPGQLPILNRAIQNKTVIGLLPTGGGKSLTYQLATLLQPGHTIIIDPIKSLMKDQVDGLARIGITGTVYINSSLKTVEEREKAMNKVSSGQALFCFISPERLMIPTFRSVLHRMKQDKRYFAYGVIDEVHCVSEWGHDFRTPYLSLGKNLLEQCHAAEGEISLFGLTATASYDVLSDVQRELSGNRPDRNIPEEAIIRHETTNRDELQVVVKRVILDEDVIDRITEKSKPEWFELNIKEVIGLIKQKAVNELIESVPEILKRFNDSPEEIVNEDLINLTYSTNELPQVDRIFDILKLPPETFTGDFWNKSCQNAGLVFTPHRSWYFGVTDRYQKSEKRNFGIYESIVNKFPILNAGTFIGVDHEDEKIANQIEKDNFRNQEDFINNKLNLMVSTKAFGMGIDKPNIRFTIHAFYPSSIESFIQEAGRAGRDRKLAASAIIYNDQRIENKANPGTYIEVDYDIQLDFYNNSFKGKDKEKAVIHELLTQISHPRRSITYDLATKLNQEDEAITHNIVFSIKFSKGIFKGFDFSNVFLNDKEGNSYGFIRLRKRQLVLEKINVDLGTAKYFLSRLWELIKEMGPSHDMAALEAWLFKEEMVDPTPGIEKVLAGLNIGNSYSITIPFANDNQKVYQRLSGLLRPLDNRFTNEICGSCYRPGSEDFLENIYKGINVTDYKTKIVKYFRSDEEKINAFYKGVGYALNSRRDKTDTEKAIYRLSLIGVIDDYTVDYNAETFTIHGKKKTNQDYHNHLRNYINKYYSNRRTEATIEGLPERKGDTEIQRILNFTIGFVYDEVAKKRREAIKAMKTCCLVGLNQGNIEMKTWIHLYFNSKYARRAYTVEIPKELLSSFRVLKKKKIPGEPGIYNASLLDWSKEGTESNFDWVIDFINITNHDSSNSQRDNLKHLRGAVTRLLITNPENYVFRLLRAFTIIVLDEDKLGERQIQQVCEDLETGFQVLWDELEGNQKQFYKMLLDYHHHVKNQINKATVVALLEDHIENIIFLGHVEWIKKFSQQFIKNLKP